MSSELTPYPDVNAFIGHYRDIVLRAYEANLIGIYLTGSLTYDAFDYGSSDIDVTNIVRRPVSAEELPILRSIHDEMEERFPQWSKRFECTYTSMGCLASIRPPREPRPWYWGGTGQLYAEAVYGNEWIINAYFLYEYGNALYGPAYRELAPPVDKTEVQQACVRDLFVEWAPKRTDSAWLAESHHQAYFVLNLCRIVAAVCTGEPYAKPVAANWVKENLDPRWQPLIDTALQWQVGVVLDCRADALAFQDFVIATVQSAALYQSMADEMTQRPK